MNILMQKNIFFSEFVLPYCDVWRVNDGVFLFMKVLNDKVSWKVKGKECEEEMYSIGYVSNW